ncbi:hypothetical protein ACHAWX_001541 [Stephanocyclus meneghinianus]
MDATQKEHPNCTDVKCNSHPGVSTVWNGLDCVLSPDTFDRLQSAWDVQIKQQQEYAESIEKSGTRRDRCSSLRRSSTGYDDFGWLRKLELRSDVPSILEIRHWSFDPLQFEENVLVKAFVIMLEYYSLLEEFHLDRETLEKYATAVMQKHHKDCYYQRTDIEGGRKGATRCEIGQNSDNECNVLCEYHNWYHAFSCAHVCFLFLTIGKADQFLLPKDIFSIIMGGLIHDLDHPGTNNDFEVKRGTKLARQYSNDSVLERHAISEGLKLCHENEDLNWLKSFDTEDRKYVENYITEAILATDPARHGGVLREALAFVEEGPKTFYSGSGSYFDRNNPRHRLFIGRLFLHGADIANPLHCSFEVARDWAVRVTTEFSRQVSKERELQLPVTVFMDGLDNEYNVAKTQISFFAFMVKPLFDSIGKLFPFLSHLNDWGERNCDEYRNVIEAFECNQKRKAGD